MGSFDVKFGLDANYFDPEYRSLYVKVIGQASVSSEERDGSESDQEIVRGLIGIGINNALSNLSSKNAPVKTLVDHKNEFTQFITESLKERNITLSSLNLMSVNPDAQSRERIEKIEKMKEMSSKSPEELEKMRQEAARKAQEYLDSLTPEQRRAAEEESKRKAEEAAEKMRQAMELARNAGAASGASPAAANAMATAAGLNAMKAAAMAPSAPAPKFCTNCGSPAGPGKFCGNCGNPL